MKIEVSLTRWSYVAQFMGVYGMVIILYMLLEKKFITGQLIGQMKDTQLFLVLLVVVLIAVIFIAGFWRRGMKQIKKYFMEGERV